MAPEVLSLAMFVAVIAVLMAGFPVAFSLAGTALGFALLGSALGAFNLHLLGSLPSRIFGAMTDDQLVAIPLFLVMGIVLERSGIGEELLDSSGRLFGQLPGGLGYAVLLVGALLAGPTGVVGATTVMMALISLPSMLRAGYDPALASGIIAASATLGQIVPPAIVLVILGDVLQGVHSQAQMAMGNFAPDPISVVDLFAGAMLPGLLLIGLFLGWQIVVAIRWPRRCPPIATAEPVPLTRLLVDLAAPTLLILLVLGSILLGFATPTESAGVGAVAAVALAAVRRRLSIRVLREVVEQTLAMTTMIFTIIFGASVFSLVFVGLDGESLVRDVLAALPGGADGAMAAVMLLVFLLGFPLDFAEICLIVVPVVGPALLMMGVDPLWFGVLIAMNLQTSFLSPPVGPTLFYLRGAAPPEVTTGAIYRGVVPFVFLQLVGLGVVWCFPGLATWLPRALFG